jgi:hypothetical protein
MTTTATMTLAMILAFSRQEHCLEMYARNLLNTFWTDVIHLFWTKNGKLVKDYMGETDIKQVICSFLREESYVVAPAKGDEAGKELLCPLK